MTDPTPDTVTALSAGSRRPADRPDRRTFSDREQIRILDATGRCSEPGDLARLRGAADGQPGGV